MSQNKRAVVHARVRCLYENLMMIGKIIRGTYDLEVPLPDQMAELLKQVTETELVARGSQGR
jgi:hypothetical protein